MAVSRILTYIARGGCVVSNIQLKLDPWENTHPFYRGKFSKEFNAMGVKEYLRRFYHWEYQEGQYRYIDNKYLSSVGVVTHLPAGLPDLPVLLVWDEGADFWDAEDRTQADREFLSLLRHSRKLGMDFLFIVQEFTELNKRIRNQTAYVWRFIDMATFRVPGLGLSVGWIPMLRNQIRVLQFQRYQFESRRDSVEPVYCGWIDKRQEIFACYVTEALHTGVRVLQGENVDFRGKGRFKIKVESLTPEFSLFVGFCFSLFVLIVGGWL